jgi:hypothetical protein
VASHPNIERTERGFRAFVERDLATITDLLREDIVWTIPGRSPLAGTYRGRDAALGALRKAVELTAGSYVTELQHVVADDERIVALYRARGRREGRELDIGQALVCRVEDGRWVEVQALPFDQYAFDEFWS